MGGKRRDGIQIVNDGRGIQFSFMYQGRRHRPSIKRTATPQKVRWAQNHLRNVEAAIQEGRFAWDTYFPGSRYAKRAAEVKLDETIPAFVEKGLALLKRKTDATTYRRYANDAVRWKEKYEGVRVADFDREELEIYLGDLNLATSRLNDLLIPLRAGFKSAMRAKKDGKALITSDPTANLELKKLAGGRKRADDVDPFRPEEIAQLMTHESGPLWKFWAWCGFRPEELIGLKKTDFLPGNRLHIQRAIQKGRVGETKTPAGNRIMHLRAGARTALERLRRTPYWNTDGEFCIRNPKVAQKRYLTKNPELRFWSDKPLRELFGRVCAEVGVRYRPPGQLRHTFATWSLEVEPIPWIAGAMGHKNVQMVMTRYSRIIAELHPQGGTKMDARFGADDLAELAAIGEDAPQADAPKVEGPMAVEAPPCEDQDGAEVAPECLVN
jgi:integrase